MIHFPQSRHRYRMRNRNYPNRIVIIDDDNHRERKAAAFFSYIISRLHEYYIVRARAFIRRLVTHKSRRASTLN